jgi:hypothetical protein
MHPPRPPPHHHHHLPTHAPRLCARAQMGLLDLVRSVASHGVWEVASNAMDVLCNLGLEHEKCDRWGRHGSTAWRGARPAHAR